MSDDDSKKKGVDKKPVDHSSPFFLSHSYNPRSALISSTSFLTGTLFARNRLKNLPAEEGDTSPRASNSSVIDYYTTLKGLWDELEDYLEVSNCTCDASGQQAKEKEVEKLHQFLMGLDAEMYGSTVSQILNTEPLPTVNKDFQMVNQEEKRKVPPRRDDRVDVATF
ncbi:hypothetical protein CRG98_040143 [Punica granatum]|uniref:Uncharacterized protein n=1 Tax=Punica granatum TaxID=22663 RepID=A0A2I0I658_PUNGR|nr:hypothetical protein CRG98_040143 [Punica granatum]